MNGDVRGATREGLGLGLNFAGAAAVGPLGVARRPGATGLSFEDALILQGDASRARIVESIGEAAQPTLDAIQRLDPNARVGFRGSLASGLKGSHKLGESMERVPFNGDVAYKLNPKTGQYESYKGPQGYDADYFIVSDRLANQLGNKPSFMNAAGLKDPGLRASLDEFGDALRSNPELSGMKPGKPKFRVFSTDDMLRKIPSDDPQYYFLQRQP
jgi:hypothetical protein